MVDSTGDVASPGKEAMDHAGSSEMLEGGMGSTVNCGSVPELVLNAVGSGGEAVVVLLDCGKGGESSTELGGC